MISRVSLRMVSVTSCERSGYNYAQHLPERREMMQAWAAFLISCGRGWPATSRGA